MLKTNQRSRKLYAKREAIYLSGLKKIFIANMDQGVRLKYTKTPHQKWIEFHILNHNLI